MAIENARILFEDNHIIVLNKKVSEIVQGDKTGDKPLVDELKDYLKKKYNKPGNVFVGLPHRLDRPVSGIVLFAKTGKALSRLNKMFKEKEIKKIYWAIVKERPPRESDTLKHYLKRNRKQNKSYAYDKEVADSKYAELDYKLISSSDRYYLLEIVLKTGRHHQIRAQLSKIGCPIKGDLKYSYPRSNSNSGIDLHARKIIFVHPVKKEEITIVAPTPKDSIWDKFE